jgi:hypothetical protein
LIQIGSRGAEEQRSRGAGEKELETNHLYQGFREMVLHPYPLIPFHFKVDTNRQQRSRGAEEQGSRGERIRD